MERVFSHNTGEVRSKRPADDAPLVVADCRPKASAQANRALGKGMEDASNYAGEVKVRLKMMPLFAHDLEQVVKGTPALQVIFLGIDNIHEMRRSLNDLRDVISHASEARGAPDPLP